MGTPRICQFGLFVLDTRTRVLSRNGARVKLTGQPYLILQALLERAGEVVTRDELREKLWAEGTFVDFERCLNTSVMTLRRALHDSAGVPRYVETVPRVGYRFIATVMAAESVVKSSTDQVLMTPQRHREHSGEVFKNEHERYGQTEAKLTDSADNSTVFGRPVDHSVKRYALAVVVAAVALLLNKVLHPFFGQRHPFHTMWLAVALSARYWRVGPAIATLVAGGLGTWYYFLAPAYSFQIQDSTDVYGLLGFVVLGAVVIRLTSSHRSPSHRA